VRKKVKGGIVANVVIPVLGEKIEKATVSYWFFKIGDQVNEKDDLVELATDKATFNLPSPVSGTLSQILCEEGQTVTIGQIVAVINENK
jgi:pyruvate/2-oxoglutarate dehydrogenase complex dihydrolipoamide acyltransferase (E2) component